MSDKVLSLLGLMRTASAIAPGEENAADAISKGKARLLLVAEDANEKAKNRAERYLEGRRALMIHLPYKNSEIAQAIGIGGCAMLAVTDMGFAKSLLKNLSEMYPGKYEAEAEEMNRRFEKAERRKREKPGAKAKK